MFANHATAMSFSDRVNEFTLMFHQCDFKGHNINSGNFFHPTYKTSVIPQIGSIIVVQGATPEEIKLYKVFDVVLNYGTTNGVVRMYEVDGLTD